MDGILALGLGVHSRSQAVGICQVLLDEGALCHGEPEQGQGSWAGQSWGAGVQAKEGWASQGASYPHSLNFLSSSTPDLFPTVKHDWTFQDRDTQFYRFPGPEPEPAGAHELEEELVEAMALLSQRGPDALLTVALRKP